MISWKGGTLVNQTVAALLAVALFIIPACLGSITANLFIIRGILRKIQKGDRS